MKYRKTDLRYKKKPKPPAPMMEPSPPREKDPMQQPPGLSTAEEALLWGDNHRATDKRR